MSDIRKRTGSRGTTYQVRYASKSAKTGYAFKTFKTRKEAVAFLQSGEAVRQIPRAAKISVEDATDTWLTICRREGLNGREPVTDYTYENYRYRASYIKAYPWTKCIQELKAPDIVLFRSWLLADRKLSRVLSGKVLASLHSVLKEMTLRGAIASNPAIGVSVRAETRYKQEVVIPSKSEIRELLAVADQLAASQNQTIAKAWKRYRPLLYLAVDSGMRPQEYLALARSAIRGNGVMVERAIEGSGKELSVTKTPAGRRFIELSSRTLTLLREYLENDYVPNGHDLVFASKDGTFLDRRNWQHRGFNVACEKAGLVDRVKVGGDVLLKPRYRPYDLRHFFASILIERETNLKKIQSLMGHENIETTLNVYGHLLEEKSRQSQARSGMLEGLLTE